MKGAPAMMGDPPSVIVVVVVQVEEMPMVSGANVYKQLSESAKTLRVRAGQVTERVGATTWKVKEQTEVFGTASW